jgi:hypothetical protein
MAAALAPAGYPRFPNLRPIGKRAISPFPIPSPSRKSGIPSPFPGQIGNRGNGNCGFPPGLMALQGQPQAEESPLAGPGHWQVLKGTEGRVPVSSCGVFPFESSSSPHRSARVPGVISAWSYSGASLSEASHLQSPSRSHSAVCNLGNRFSSLQFLLLALHLDLVG